MKIEGSFISTEGLNFNPEDAQWDGKEVVGCKQHWSSQITKRSTPTGEIVICIPNKDEAHILATS